MSEPAENKPVVLSQKLYRRLLAAYPKVHREEYGPAMAQLFRDQCRDAWREARWWGLVMLWLRVVPDLIKTSVLEHLTNLKGRKSMLEKIAVILRPHSAPRSVFRAVAVVVFLLVFGTSALITFILPESYSSTVRIKAEKNAGVVTRVDFNERNASGFDPYWFQAEFETIVSKSILHQVITNLGLNNKWAKKFNQEAELPMDVTYGLLKRQIDVRQSRNTSLIEIRAFSEDKNEAAIIANEIAKVYHDGRLAQRQAMVIEIVDKAEPAYRPVRPNKPLNLFLGAVGGMLLALVAGAATAWVAFLIGRNMRRKAAAS